MATGSPRPRSACPSSSEVRPRLLQALERSSGLCGQQGAAESRACGTAPVQTRKEGEVATIFHQWVVRTPPEAGLEGQPLLPLSRALISCHSQAEPPALAGGKGPPLRGHCDRCAASCSQGSDQVQPCPRVIRVLWALEEGGVDLWPVD
ncbi:hypothetical protein P7K49_036430 [Saguinus oedipus]|uniref:Uncharacterized protein n=1 Tax=Saguinus oedipus TaxID=9490 RepID=A0ABQ9TK31_SAGOE|nr:hypothetical protein P7K49_036430 [Saguinus oedipus]